MLGVSVGVIPKDLANVILSVKTLIGLTSTLTCVKVCIIIISARQHICYSALYAIARPSVRPSVCLSVPLSVPLSVTRVDQSKTVTVRITQLSPQSSPMTLVS